MFLSTGGTNISVPINSGLMALDDSKVFLQAHLGNNMAATTFVSGNSNVVSDTRGTGNWKFYVAGGNSIASVTGASNSTEWTAGSLLSYFPTIVPVVFNYSLFYPFSSDKVSGTTVYDTVTNYAGTLINGATIAVDANSRISGQGYLKLNSAASQYMSIPSFTPATGGISFSFWFYLNSNPEWGRMFDFSSGGSDNIFCATRNQYVKCGLHGTPVGNIALDIFAIPSNNVWCHLVWTIASDGRWIVYLNGTSVYNVVNYYPPAGTRSSHCYFGNSNYSEYYKGGIDNFRYYNYVLSPSNVTSIYNSGDNDPAPAIFKNDTTGVAWMPSPAAPVNSSELSYTVKSNEIALTPGTNSTYAVWTATKSTNIKVDVSFADYHTRNVGVGFQMFKIKSDNTFDSVLFPRTVTTAALTNANSSNSSNYLSVPSVSTTVTAGDKIYLRVDANGNTTAASSVLATNIYTDAVSIANNPVENRLLQANLAANLNSATFVSGNSNTVLDTAGNSNWQFYVAGGNSIASITGASNSTEWTDGSLLSYNEIDYYMFYPFNTNSVSGSTLLNLATNSYGATLYGGASIVNTVPSPATQPPAIGSGYLSMNVGTGQYVQLNQSVSLNSSGSTISFWVRWTSNVSNAPIFSYDDGTNYAVLYMWGDYWCVLARKNDGITNSAYAFNKTEEGINTGDWVHMSIKTNNGQVFVNGILSQQSGQGTIGSFSSIVQPTRFYFGNTHSSVTATDFSTKTGTINIDNFVIYNKILSDEEIGALYSNSRIYYTFDSDSVTGNNVGNKSTGTYVNDATLVNSASIGTLNPSPAPTSGTGHLQLTSTNTIATNQYVQLSFQPTFAYQNNKTAFSVSFWARSNSTLGSSAKNNFFDFANSIAASENANYSFSMYLQSNNIRGKISYGASGVAADDYVMYTDSSILTDNVWRHYVWTVDSAVRWKLYINSVLVFTKSSGFNQGYPLDYLAAIGMINYTSCFIGRDAGSWQTASFSGAIDEFRWYRSRVIGQVEVSVLYATQVSVGKFQNPSGGNPTWIAKPTFAVDSSETSYTVKSNEIAIAPGANSTYAVWTAPKTTNIKVDVSFADYHTRSAGVGFQMFKINNDNTFGSVIYPRTVTSVALTNANPNNYLSVPSRSVSVTTGDKIYLRIDANGNPTSASSVLSTNIYVDPNQDLKQPILLQAHLGNNMAATTFVSGNANVVADTRGTGSWKFYVAGGNSIASITGASNSSEWTGGNLLSYVGASAPPPTDFSMNFTFNTDKVSGTTITDSSVANYSGTLVGVGATIATTTPSPAPGSGYLSIVNTYSPSPVTTNHLALPPITPPTGGMTLSFWLNPRENRASYIIQIGNGQFNNNIIFFLGGTNLHGIVIKGSSQGPTVSVSPTNDINVTNGTWKHVVWTLNPTNEYKFYFNGSLSNTLTGATYYYPNNVTTTQNYIGRSSYAVPYYNGDFDDFRIYNRILTSDEAYSVFMAGAQSKFNDSATGVTWMPTPATPVDSSETDYTVKSNEIALRPGANSTYAVWTATKSTNLKIDVSFADYHSRSAGVGFQMFKIKSDNTFDSVLFPRTVTSTALTNAAPNNYLPVPSVSTSVSAGDKIYLRVDANGNTTAASSVLATTIFTDAVSAAPNPVENRLLQAHLGNNLNSTTFVSGNANTVLDTLGTSNWQFYAASSTSVAAITSASASTEWTGGSLLSYDLGNPLISSYSFDTTTQSGNTIKNTTTNAYDLTLINGATIGTVNPSPYSSLNSGYLTLNMSAGQYATSTTPVSFSRPFTISVWVRYTGTYPTITGSVRPTLIEIGDANKNSIMITAADFSTTNLGLVLLFTGGVYAGGFSYRPTSGNATVWNHFVFTFNSVDNTVTSYVNGVLSESQTSITWNAPASLTYLNFGKTEIPTETNPNTGSWTPCIDKFQIFNVSLSASQVSSLYNNTFVAVDNPTLKNTVAGVIWKPFPATVVDDTETSYTIKSNEVALTPGTNSTFAVWTAPKSTNIKVDVSFADYHSRNVGVGFQMFKINADNTFGSVIYPRTVTSVALTNAAPNNYLSVPSKTISVATGDKLYYRVDANGNPTSASSVLATTIYVDPNQDLKQYNVLQANLGNNIATTSFVSGNANVVNDTRGTGSWKFYVAGGNSIASITGLSNSTEWTAGSLLTYSADDYSVFYPFNTNTVSGSTVLNMATNAYDLTLYGGASIINTVPSPASQPPSTGSGYLQMNTGAGQYAQATQMFSLNPAGSTISLWFRWTAGSADVPIFSYDDGNNFVLFYIFSEVWFVLVKKTGGTQTPVFNFNATQENITIGNWVHITILTATGTTYVNGVLSQQPSLGSFSSFTQPTKFYLGNSSASPTFIMDGRDFVTKTGTIGVDNFVIYNKTLTATEIMTLYAKPNLYYPFETADINPGNPLQVGDVSTGPYVYSGTLVGGATIAVDAGSRVAGKGYLKATSTAHKMSLLPVSTGANGLTFALWFKMPTIRQDFSLFDFNDGGDSNNQICVRTAYLNQSTGEGPRFYTIIGSGGGYGGIYVGSFSEWTHFVFVLTPPGNIATYVNGSLHTTITNYAYPASSTRVNHSVLGWQGSNQVINAGVDDFRFYNRAITAAEITYLYSGPPQPTLKDDATGVAWMPIPATPVNSSETSYTVKSNEVALKPGTNSTYAVWTATKSTNIKVDVSFADYHSRSSAGVGFQMFKIKSDNTFDSVLFPRTVTSTALTNAAPNNYLPVPSVTTTVIPGDKIYIRVDANGNTTAASSVLATNIYTDAVSSATNPAETRTLQANLASNLNATTLVTGNANVVLDTVGNGDWKFYVANGNSIAAISSASNSTEWTGGSLLTYSDLEYSMFYPFNTNTVSGSTVLNMATNTYDLTLYNGASIINTVPFPASQPQATGSGYLSMNVGTNQYAQAAPTYLFNPLGSTISFWVRWTSNVSNAPIFSYGSAATTLFLILLVNSTSIQSSVKNVSYTNTTIKNYVSQPNQVYITLLTANGGVYLDGVSIGTAAFPLYGAGVQPNYFYFGTYEPAINNIPGFTYNMSGKTGTISVDNFVVFNKTLTASEVMSLYSGSSPPSIKDSATGVTWIAKPAIAVDSTETLYTIKSNEIALTPGTNSTYAVWTAPKSTNIRVDVSFADYHSRTAGVGFQMFKINNDNTFGSTIFPRTVTSTALTNAAPNNYLNVPSVSLSVTAGDKVYYRIDANGNTTSASSVISTNIYSYSGKWN